MKEIEGSARSKKEFFVECDCHSEVIHVVCDFWGNSSYDYEFSVYRHGEQSFWNKCRMIWKIIRTGHPYGDDVILGKEKAEELARWILEEKSENNS